MTILALSLPVFLKRIVNRGLIVVSPADTGVSAADWECSAVLREYLLKILSGGNCAIPLLYTVLDRILEVGSYLVYLVM